VPQPGIKSADRSQHSHGAIAILDAGDVHDQSDEMTACIGDDVPLAAHDLLARVKAARTTALGSVRNFVFGSK
jgi:hypothetical protein